MRSFFLAAAALLCLPGCADLFGPLGGNDMEQVWVTSTGHVLTAGDTVHLSVRAGRDNTVLYEHPGTPVHHWPSSVPLQWSSSNPAVATVDESGVVRAASPGRTTITARSGGVRDTATIVVRTEGGAIPAAYRSLELGLGHTCALATGGQVHCWGDNWHGEMGVGHARRHTETLAPVAALGGAAMSQITAGALHSCALDGDGAAFCWGDAAEGVLGDPDIPWTANAPRPVRVVGDYRYTALVSGLRHNCGLLVNGGALCWGMNDFGQLGAGSAGRASARPLRVLSDVPFRSLTAGLQHTCALDLEGRAFCWGSNESGQLGTGDPSGSSVPVSVALGHRFVALDAGTAHTCGLTVERVAYCWGKNWYGQLGTGREGGISLRPVPVAGGLTFSRISAGGDHTCGIATNGSAYCWGSNWRGQLGDGFPFERKNYTAADLVRATPQEVLTSQKFTEIRAGSLLNTCAVTSDGAAYCWGSGALGIGRIPRVQETELHLSSVPVRVAAPL